MIISYRIDRSIFERFPEYIRGVVIARGVTNRPSPDELVELLRQAESDMRANVDVASLAEHAQIASWREAYRWFGARPSQFRSSIEAMSRRVLRDQQLPTINALVDIGNVISLRHMVPAGFHAFDVATQDFELRPATGSETFVALGSEEQENPDAGEIILVEGERVLTRRWTWRQAIHTATGLDSTDVELNIDGLPPVTFGDVRDWCDEAADLVAKFCGGEIEIKFLTRETPCIVLSE